jgi:hypothetical protein
MDDIVHFMLRPELDPGPAKILQNDAAHRGRSLGRKQESFLCDLLWRDRCMRCQAVVAWKGKNQRVRTHAPVDQILHVLFRPDEGGIELASHQGLGEHRGVIARQADFDARKLVAKDALHFGQQANFGPRHEAQGKCRPRRLGCAQRCFLGGFRLNQRHSCMVEKGFPGRRQLSTLGAAMDQLNADFLFEIADLPAE